VKHYQLDVGLLQVGDAADLIVVDHLETFNVLQTYVNGKLIAENGTTLIQSVEEEPINKFYVNNIIKEDIQIADTGEPVRVIQALDGELITPSAVVYPKAVDGFLVSDTESDLLKMLVLNRYEAAKPALAFIKGIGFKTGAIASSVAHDSHNIVAVGVSDEEILRAVALVNQSKGGISWVNGDSEEVLDLPVAGIMSHRNASEVAMQYDKLDKLAKSLGSSLKAPYMTLSFMALLVIPELKLSDKGLFDGNTFSFVELTAPQT
jgi:adenine deaminase